MQQPRGRESNLWKVLLLLSILSMSTEADWIDPDTPEDARTTVPLNVKPPPPYRPPDSSHAASHKTVSPAPTTSPSPTQSPSEAPSSFPTWTPREFELVFSDEFNTPRRNFGDGVDPRWTALDKNDYTNDALHYYSPMNAVTDDDGHLVIKSEAADTDVIGFDDVKRKKTKVTKHFRSAMLQTWNKFCFTGGIVEAEVILPGKSTVGGLWPAFWMLGNLARHTYVGTSEHIWPWSSTACTKKSATAQRISGCDRASHYGMESKLGRGAPEIDIFEVQPGNIPANHGAFLKTPVGQPFMSASFQVAPGRPSMRPGPGWWPGPGQWYEGLIGGKNTSVNILFYGNYNHFLSDIHPATQDYWSDAISYNRQLDEDYFRRPHVYRLEWDVPSETSDGYLHWFLDNELVLSINGTGIIDAGLGSEISSEPSYILLNTAISKQWGFPHECPGNCECKVFDCNSKNWSEHCGFSEGFCPMMTDSNPPEYKINWVRVYQDPNDPLQKVGCSTPERPTRRWIEAHQDLYKTENDAYPLRGIQRGLGMCDPRAFGVIPEACGGDERGVCTAGRVCECKTGWTGPHCLAHQGRDPILYDEPDRITDVGFIPPSVAPVVLLGGLGALLVLIVVSARFRRKFDGWTPLPNVDPDAFKK